MRFATIQIMVASLALQSTLVHAAPQTSSSAPTTVSSHFTIQSMSKPQVIANLNAVLQRQIQTLNMTDQEIRQVATESTQISLRASDQVAMEKQLRGIPERLTQLQLKREELRLRHEFLSRLTFQVDSHWSGQPFAGFLEQQLIEMAITELTGTRPTENSRAQADTLAKFCIYLSVAIREISEPREDMVAFIAGYMEFSSVRDPRSPIAYAESRHYTNGSASQTARPVNKQDLSTVVDQRMKELSLAQDPAANQVSIENPTGEVRTISPEPLNAPKKSN